MCNDDNKRDKSEKQRFDEFYRLRDEIFERQRLNANMIDKAILTLSSASFGVSFAFITKIVLLKDASCLILLKLSWIAFGLAILSTIISFLLSQQALKNQLDYGKKYLVDSIKEYKEKKNPWVKTTDFLNISSSVIFIIGLVHLLIFICINF